MVRRVYLGQNFELRKTKIDFEAPKTTIIHGKGELNLNKEE
jgi:lipopolysaccharide export system ATP-binding protein